MKSTSKKFVALLVVAVMAVGLCIGALAIDNYEPKDKPSPTEYSHTDEKGITYHASIVPSTYTYYDEAPSDLEFSYTDEKGITYHVSIAPSTYTYYDEAPSDLEFSYTDEKGITYHASIVPSTYTYNK